MVGAAEGLGEESDAYPYIYLVGELRPEVCFSLS